MAQVGLVLAPLPALEDHLDLIDHRGVLDQRLTGEAAQGRVIQTDRQTSQTDRQTSQTHRKTSKTHHQTA